MSILKRLVTKMAVTGEAERDVVLPDGSTITLRPLNNAQTTAAFGIVSTTILRKVAGDKEELEDTDAPPILFQDDTILRARTIALIAYAIKKVDDDPILEEGASRNEELKLRREMLLDLLDMEEALIDLLHNEYNELLKSRRAFFRDIAKNAEK